MRKLALLMIFCFGAVIGNFGQNKIITKEEYNAALSGSVPKADKIPFRMIDTTKFFTNKKVDEIRTFISENLPPDKKRWLSTVEKDGVVTEKMESITIGKIEYTRKNNEDWTKRDLTVSGSGGTGGFKIGGPLDTKELHQYILAPTTLDNQPSNLYFYYHVLQIENVLHFLESRHWLNRDGLIIKSTTKQGRTIPDNVVSLQTRDYEYNPKDLKIEAPVKP